MTSGFKENLDDLVAESLSKIKRLHHWSTPCRKLIVSSQDWKIGEPNFSALNWFEQAGSVQ